MTETAGPVDLQTAASEMQTLINEIACALVDNTGAVIVETFLDAESTVIRLRVAPEDIGKVIGKQGRTARSVRTILNAAGMKLRKRFTLEILE